MLCLWFSLSSSFLFLSLWKENECLISVQKKNFQLHSENFLFNLEKILKKTNHLLCEVKEICFTFTPGGQTGIRISLTFISILKALNSEIVIYNIDTLFLQSGGDKNCISLLTINSQKNKYYIAIYKKKKCLLNNKIINEIELKALVSKFSDFLILKDFSKVNFLENFLKLKLKWNLVRKIESIKEY